MKNKLFKISLKKEKKEKKHECLDKRQFIYIYAITD